MTRSKQESTAPIKPVNLVMKRDSVFMAFSSGKGPSKPYSGGRTPSLLILFGCGSAALGTTGPTSPRLAAKVAGFPLHDQVRPALLDEEARVTLLVRDLASQVGDDTGL